jgi:hypothetical protein
MGYININLEFISAVKRNDISYINYSLKTEEIDPKFNNYRAIRLVCDYGYIEIAKLLIKDGRFDFSSNENYQLVTSIHHRNYDMINLLLDCNNVDVTIEDNFLIRTLISYGERTYNEKIISILEKVLPNNKLRNKCRIDGYNFLSKKYFDNDDYVKFVKCLENISIYLNNYFDVRILMNHCMISKYFKRKEIFVKQIIDVFYQNNRIIKEILKMIISTDEFLIFKYIIEKNKNFDLSYDNNFLLTLSIKNNRKQFINYLICNNFVFSKMDNRLRLLFSPNYNPTIKNNFKKQKSVDIFSYFNNDDVDDGWVEVETNEIIF